MDLAYLHPSCPYRPVSWRWLLALHLADEPGSVLRPHADAWVERAVPLVGALRRCGGEGDLAALAEGGPDLAHAHALYAQAPPHRRWAVEARVLAGEPPGCVAGKHGLPPGAVEHFERLFFDARPRLGHPDFIMTQVVGPRAYTGLTPADVGVLWKWLGYLYGPVVLDTLIPLGHRVFDADAARDADAVLDRETRLVILLKMATAVRMPLTEGAALPILGLYARLLETEREAAAEARARAAAEARASQELESVLARVPETPTASVAGPVSSASP
jgi:hypothetical protein